MGETDRRTAELAEMLWRNVYKYMRDTIMISDAKAREYTDKAVSKFTANKKVKGKC